MKNQYQIFLISLLVVYQALAHAQNSATVVSPKSKQLIEEVVHSFSVQKLVPETILVGQSAIALTSNTPEKTVQAWLLAMKQSSYSDVMSFWDVAAREKSRALDVSSNKSNAQWEREWRNLMANSSAFVTNKITYSDYILLSLEIRDQNKAVTLKETVALKNSEGAWRLTYDLVENIVFSKWDSDQTRIQRLASPLFKKIQSK